MEQPQCFLLLHFYIDLLKARRWVFFVHTCTTNFTFSFSVFGWHLGETNQCNQNRELWISFPSIQAKANLMPPRLPPPFAHNAAPDPRPRLRRVAGAISHGSPLMRNWWASTFSFPLRFFFSGRMCHRHGTDRAVPQAGAIFPSHRHVSQSWHIILFWSFLSIVREKILALFCSAS